MKRKWEVSRVIKTVLLKGLVGGYLADTSDTRMATHEQGSHTNIAKFRHPEVT